MILLFDRSRSFGRNRGVRKRENQGKDQRIWNWRSKRKIEREGDCSQIEDRLWRGRKDSPRLLSLPFMRTDPLILHESCQDPTERCTEEICIQDLLASPPQHGCLPRFLSHFIFPRPSTLLPQDVPRASPPTSSSRRRHRDPFMRRSRAIRFPLPPI